MRYNWLEKDRVARHINEIVKKCAEPLGMEILSVILYGSRARGERSSQNDYEILLLASDETKMDQHIRFTNTIKLTLIKEKFLQVKISVYTPAIFEEIMYNDEVLGTFLYMICRENIILYDKLGTFQAIRERIVSNPIKKEETFLIQCVAFAKMLESEKWERKWEKTLVQFRYQQNRNNYY
jgi:uncharacterized protein